MVKKAEAFLAVSIALVGAALACGDGNLNFSSFAGSACTNGVPTQWYQTGTTACATCVSQNCSAQERCLPDACKGYGQCFCACGVGDLNCYSGCQPQLSADCTTCESTASDCVATHCTSSCGDGGVGASSGSEGGAPPAVCASLAKCCKTQTGVAAQVCSEVAANNDVSVCQAAYAGLLDAGGCH